MAAPARFLASEHGTEVRIPITIACGYINEQQVWDKLSAGTVLGKITASGKYGPYDDSATDGRQTAVGILGEDVDATSSDVGTFMYVHCIVYASQLTGLDANGKADLKGQIIFL
ncbi:head decoration protein [bacterium]|nr:head decoration protein [bacterium]